MVLVTGGTGLVGSHLLLHLARDNKKVRALFRDERRLPAVQKVFSYYSGRGQELFDKIQWVKADITDIPALEEAFEHITEVYHAAAMISFDPKDYRKLKTANVTGTANIVNLCIAHQINKLCYVSTIGTIGKSLNGIMANEETDWNSQYANVYALTKYRAEMEVWRASQEGLATVIINPGVILGPGFWQSGSGALFTTANKGYRFYPPGGTAFISVGDVVKMMVTLMQSDIVSQRYIAIAENISYKNILAAISKQLGKREPSWELKIWQLKVGRVFDYLKNQFDGKGRMITKKSIESLLHRDDYDNQKIKDALDFKFEPLDQVISFCCQRFAEEHP